MIAGGFRKKFGGAGHQEGADETQDKTEESVEASLMQDQITALEERNKELENKLVSAVAEVRNTIARTDASIAQNRVYAIESFIKDFIDPFENLMIVLGNLEGAAHEALEMVLKKFFATLEKHGIKRVHPIGEKFDHDFHQAISMEVSDTAENGSVIKVVKAGYTLSGRVVSPALVVVANNG